MKVTFAVDEGGLRCRWKKGAAYIAFHEIVDASLADSFFGPPALVLDVAGEKRRLPIANANPFDVLGAVLANAGRPWPSRRLTALARADRDLLSWLEVVRDRTAPQYREAAASVALLAGILADAAASIDDRAAAAHALLTLGGDSAVAEVARTCVTRALPPLVLVAARLAPGGAALVEDELFTDLRDYLPPADAAAAAAAPSQTNDENAAKIRAALEQAKHEASLTFSRGDPHVSRKRAQVMAGGVDTTRWVGKSWAL